jgi:hypothetical protein
MRLQQKTTEITGRRFSQENAEKLKLFTRAKGAHGKTIKVAWLDSEQSSMETNRYNLLN